MRLSTPVTLVCLVLVTTACSSTSRTALDTPADRTPASPRAGAEQPASQPEALFRAASQGWMGVPYRLGGVSRRGIDCSAFVQILYRDALGLDLPRTTTDQVEIGTSVPEHELLPGDLVFFRPYNRNHHVGVYLSQGEFIHASTSNGVMVSRLDEPYWRDHYWTARRILAATPMPVAVPDAAPSPAARRVVGW